MATTMEEGLASRWARIELMENVSRRIAKYSVQPVNNLLNLKASSSLVPALLAQAQQ